MDYQSKSRLLIFIVAYNAENHIESVLGRIPKEIFSIYDYEILIIDDSSKDQTFTKAHAYKKANPDINLTILYNPINQGYGGNQKLGYHYAILNGFDVVVLLHGDGQYAPEIMDDLIKPIVQQKAEAVFGSRMLKKGDALKGGMPLYKYVGNKVLTRVQNKVLGSQLSEFHSGYRAYSVQAMSVVPFERNSNDFHFDTHIIIQFFLAGHRIKEVPIPTFYGDEICHVNGYKYAWDVFKSTIGSRLHEKSIFYNRIYDVREYPDYSLKLGYPSSHQYTIDRVSENANVLDIGAGFGLVAEQLTKKGCKVTGIDCVDVDNDIFEAYHKEDLDQIKMDFPVEKFDYVIMLDIIEHLKDPDGFMDLLRKKLGMSRPTIIMTTPNIAFLLIRLQLLLGNFNYGKQGILDLTHKRLFTFKSMKRFAAQCGFEVKKIRGVPVPFQKAMGNNLIARLFMGLNRFGIGISKGLFSYQIYMELEPTPVLESLLDLAQKTSSIKETSVLVNE